MRDNDIYMCRGASGSRGATLTSRRNIFEANRYHVDGFATAWVDETRRSWTEWQALGHDATGTRATSCDRL